MRAVSLLAAISLAAAAPKVALGQEMNVATGAVILRVKRGTNNAALQRLVKQLGATISRDNPSMSAVLLRMPAGVTAAGIAASLQASSIVEYAEPEVKMYAFGTPNDPSFSKQWGFLDTGYGIHAATAWNTVNGSGITVAVVDTGVRKDCPDLAGTQILAGHNALNNTSNTTDDNGHGTHVSGTIAQTTNNGYGCAGIAYEAAILPVKVLGADGSGSNFSVAAGIRWAADHGARVINLSLGGGGGSTLLEAVRYAVAKGAVVCAAAGNGGNGSLSYPAAYSETISVGAIASTGKRASFSQYGTGLSVVAPGVGILQQTWSPQQGKFIFGSWNGTSMATPHVAGTCALVLQRNPQLTPVQVEDLLQRTARDLGSPGWDSETGHGLIDAAAAVNGAGGSTPAPTPGNPAYDVAVSQIQAPGTAPLNSNAALGVQVQNLGISTVDVKVSLNEGPASDAIGSTTLKVAAGETSTANFTWPTGSQAGSRQLTANASIVGQTDGDPSDNSRVASVNVGGSSSLKLRVYTYKSTYKVGNDVYLRHIVETSSGVRLGGASVQGTLTGSNGKSFSYSGTSKSDGTYVVGVRLTGGGGTGTYNISAQASKADAGATTGTWQFQVVR